MHKETGNYYESGYNAGSDVPEEDYYPTDRKERAEYSDKTSVSFESKPGLVPVKIKGKMSNEHKGVMDDARANSTMRSMMKRGKAKSGYYYRNIGEDTDSISAVVPNKEWLEMVKSMKYVILQKGRSIKEWMEYLQIDEPEKTDPSHLPSFLLSPMVLTLWYGWSHRAIHGFRSKEQAKRFARSVS